MNRSIVHSQYPGLTLSAKTSFTSLDEFQKLGIQIANEEYTTHPEIIRYRVIYLSNQFSKPVLQDTSWSLTDNCHAFNKKQFNKIYREKSIPMTALWCPAFSYHG